MRRFLTSSFEEAADYNRLRRDTLKSWDGSLSAPSFDWVREPVLNPYTRLAVAMCPATGVLRVVGYDKTAAACAGRAGDAYPRNRAGNAAAGGVNCSRKSLQLSRALRNLFRALQHGADD